MRLAISTLLLVCACAAPDAAPVESAPEPAAAAGAKSAPRFVSQPGWVEQPPSTGMRKVQYVLPGAAGEAGLIVYYFGPSAGSLEANLERWAGQFEQPDGAPSAERMRLSERAVGDLALTVVDLAGTYVAETSPGSGEFLDHPGWRMLVAVIEAPEGPYYAKLTGPAATLAAWEATFDDFLGGLRER